MEKKNIIFFVTLITLFAETSFAGFGWNGSNPANNLWDTPGNWDGGTVPTTNDDIYVPAGLANEPIIQTGINAYSNWLRIGEFGAATATLTIAGGTLETHGVLRLGETQGVTGKVEMSGGIVNIISNFECGFYGDGVLNITGGQINIGWQLEVPSAWTAIPDSLAGAGLVKLHGGNIDVSGNIRIRRSGCIDIEAGVLTIDGDHRSLIDTYINDGLITAYQGRGTVLVDYDKTNPGETTVTATAEPVITQYCNALEVRLPDPAILKTTAGQYSYYMCGTGLERFVSNDLVNWRLKGLWADPTPPGYTFDSLWACEIVEKNDQFYLYFTAKLHGPTGNEEDHKICVATASSPDGEFQPLAYPMWDDGYGYIDQHVFVDDDGKNYVYAVRTPNGGIYGAELKDNMHQLQTGLSSMLNKSDQWEEAPFLIKRNGTYYMTYTVGGYQYRDYHLEYATASNPLGPWTIRSENFLKNDSTLPEDIGHTGTGHNGMVRSLDNSELFVVYHSHRTSVLWGYRQANIDRIAFNDSTTPPTMSVQTGPIGTKTPQPYPSGSPFASSAVFDGFDDIAQSNIIWSNVWGENPDAWSIDNSKLTINCKYGDTWQNSILGENVFLQYAPAGNWKIATRATIDSQENYETAFLTVWQDENNYIMLKLAYVNGRKFEIAKEINEVYSAEYFINPIGDTVYLQIRKIGDQTYQCLVSSDGISWTRVGSQIAMPMHDIKVGLGAWNSISERTGVIAEFDYFNIERPKASDYDKDMDVDIDDLSGFMSSWLDNRCAAKPVGDLNDNCNVDLEDFAIFAEDWLWGDIQ